MSQKYVKLKNLLKELFQLDQPDLDFGLYRIMRVRSKEISQFLDTDLLPQVKASFAAYQPADKAAIQAELDKAVVQAQALGAEPEILPRVIELRAKLANEAVDIGSLENEVYDHLYGFFRRYYSEGDFISKRVYKEGVYAIPYEGEEVKLHWANADQYYIKTSEYLRDYAFRLNPGNDAEPKRVHFRLADVAEGEHGNVKETEGKNRVFVLASEKFVSEENKELIIYFVYRPATLNDWPDDQRAGKTKPPAQKELITISEKRLLAVNDASLASWIADLGKKHTKADGETADYTKLTAHLNRYTARNTFDYFIHKDLGKFLNRELDFYIKNEVMHLDDVESETVPRVEQYLSKIKVIRKVAKKIIDFLAQLEDFQKKLWLKKKFVVETNYCITLDRVPEEFYAKIAENKAQIEEWVNLFAIDEIQSTSGDLLNEGKPGYSVPLEVAFLKANDKLMLDTRFFSDDFKARLIGRIENFDEQMDGLLIHSENFQALNLLQERYREQVSIVYADPPYNAKSSEIVYKNTYKHSSWMSLMCDRINLSARLKRKNGALLIAIDENEFVNLLKILSYQFPNWENNCISIVHNPAGIQGDNFSYSHEYCIYSYEKQKEMIGKTNRLEESEESFRDWGGTCSRSLAKNCFYPILVKDSAIIGFGDVCPDDLHPGKSNINNDGIIYVYPIAEDGEERKWVFARDSVDKIFNELSVRERNGEVSIIRTKTVTSYKTVWYDKKYYANIYGSKLLNHIIGNKKFDFPKSVYTIQDCLYAVTSVRAINSICIDYFAGSGTTGHAVINLNREDNGKRKFILVEMGDYFDTVLKPRILKVIYSENWKGGKPEQLSASIVRLKKEIADAKKAINELIGFDETEEYKFEKQRLNGAVLKAAKGIERIQTIIDSGVNSYGGITHCLKYLRLETYEDTLNNLDLRRTDAQTNLLDFKGEGADKFKEDYTLHYILDVESRGSSSLLNIEAFTDPTAYNLKVKIPGSDESREVKVDLLETFNYLLGLQIRNISAPHTISAEFDRDSEKRLRIKGIIAEKTDGAWWFRTVTGTTLDGRKTLVIWRKRPGLENSEGVEQDNLVLDTWFTKMGYSSKDSEFDTIYVNGTNNLENLKTPDDLWKVRLIEEDFKRLMFEDTGV